ncbi:MAG: tRNA uridine-5-carboxymethylaminomethyl(34) synthesis enzyme MnmG [Bdellovibrionales bacterium]
MSIQYDIIVVGAGHAGIEACLAPSRMGLKVLLITSRLDRIGFMSCNPSIGGLGKGHIVKEIDALGGEMGFAADKNCVQFKKLNSKKGPAVRGTRMQEDKDKYCEYMMKRLSEQENLSLLENEVKTLILDGDACRGVRLADGSEIKSHSVILTTGTFMNAIMHIGVEKVSGGRVGEKATIGISDQLNDFGFEVQRLKTGTPPRLKRSSIDFSKTQEEFGDSSFIPFSYRSSPELELKQISCYLTYTNERTHDVIRKHLDKSPMYTGEITGSGPRYCPSIEDKITRFSDRDRHQSFLEPEGVDSDIIYLQGISTSLPEVHQYEFLKTIAGLEKVELLKPGYAVEYDFIIPTQIFHSLETKNIKSLYLAGQINGTSGYEEAGGQGLVAGVNAASKILNKNEFVLGRDESYIGVLIDDLVTKGTKEPYRMFTSRAEHRLMLREDNALDRLFKKASDYSLIPEKELSRGHQILNSRAEYSDYLKSHKLVPSPSTNKSIEAMGMTPLVKPNTLEEFLRRPEVNTQTIHDLGYEVPKEHVVYDPVEVSIKYAGYIRRQGELIRQAKKLEDHLVPTSIEYSRVAGLSSEEREKLGQIRPRTLGQASRISGVNPSAIQALMLHLRAYKPPKSAKHR